MFVYESIFAPLSIVFLIMMVGYFIGKIKIFHISLGPAGTLFVAILFGMIVERITPNKDLFYANQLQDLFDSLSQFGSSLFISIIGITSGLSIFDSAKKNLPSFFMGSLMSCTGIGIMELLSHGDKTIDHSMFLGLLCGALTSTPGLSVICESPEIIDTTATWGYAATYLPSVILTVLSVQLIHPKSESPKQFGTQSFNIKNTIFPEFVLIALSVVVGSILGKVKIPMLNLSIGNTAGTLLVGILIGIVAKKAIPKDRLSMCTMNMLKQLGLTLFFVGTGYSAGLQTVNFSPSIVSYGIIITTGCILTGILLNKTLFSKQKINAQYIIAGGMTSSPAFGIIHQSSDDTSNCQFSFAYLGALITLVFAIQFIH